MQSGAYGRVDLEIKGGQRDGEGKGVMGRGEQGHEKKNQVQDVKEVETMRTECQKGEWKGPLGVGQSIGRRGAGLFEHEERGRREVL